MKKYLILILSISAIVFGQNVQVVSNQPLTKIEQGEYFFPQVSPTGENILFTSANYDGIWLYSNINAGLKKIVDASGAGYEPKFSANGEQIIYRKNEFVNNLKYSSIHKFDLQSSNMEMIENRSRNLTPPLRNSIDAVSYVVNGTLVVKNNSNTLQKSDESSATVVTIENSDMVLYSNGERIVYTPLGKGNYLWPSISPDGTKLLFTLAGVGTFVTNFEGIVISELGNAHYPNWSSDGKWIVYMEDYDDGYNVTDSEIFLVSADGGEKVNLTNTDDINEMYPKWSPVDDEIVYNTTDGIIYKLKLRID